jgi:hypothetical protein
VAYATRADVLATFDTPPSDAGKLAWIDDLLVTVSDTITGEVGFDFNRHPNSGTETRVLDGYGGSRLHVHEGIVGTPAISFASSFGGTLTLIATGDLLLEAEDPSSGAYDHVSILGASSGYGSFPNGRQLISVTAAFGFPTVPTPVKRATVDWVRQAYDAGPAVAGGVVGPEEFGRPMMLPRMPDSAWRVVRHYQSRFASCYVTGGF